MSRDICTWCQSTRALPIPSRRWRKRKKLEFRRLLSHLDVEVGQHEAAGKLEGFSVFTSALRKGRITANVVTMHDAIHVFVISVQFSDGTRWSSQCGKRKPTLAGIVLLSRLRISGEGRRFTVDKLDGLPFLSPGPVNVGRSRSTRLTPVRQAGAVPTGNPGKATIENMFDVFSAGNNAIRGSVSMARPIDDRPSNFIGGNNDYFNIRVQNIEIHNPAECIQTRRMPTSDNPAIAWCNPCAEEKKSAIFLGHHKISADIRQQLLDLCNRLDQRQSTPDRGRYGSPASIGHYKSTKQKIMHFCASPNPYSCIGAGRFLTPARSDKFGAQYHAERSRVHERDHAKSSVSIPRPAQSPLHHRLQ